MEDGEILKDDWTEASGEGFEGEDAAQISGSRA